MAKKESNRPNIYRITADSADQDGKIARTTVVPEFKVGLSCQAKEIFLEQVKTIRTLHGNSKFQGFALEWKECGGTWTTVLAI